MASARSARVVNVASVARTLDRKWNVVWRWLVKHKLRPDKFRKGE